jgi:hypothetical protein
MADWYAERLAESSAPHQLAIAAVLQLLPAVTGEPVLDLGCGEGLVARTLAKQGCDGAAGWCSPSRIRALRPRMPAGEPRLTGARPQLVNGYSRSGSGVRSSPRASVGPATGIGCWPPTSTPWSMVALWSRGSLNRSRARPWRPAIRAAPTCRCSWSCGRLDGPSRQPPDPPACCQAGSNSGTGPPTTEAPGRLVEVAAEELAPSLRWVTATTIRTTGSQDQ